MADPFGIIGVLGIAAQIAKTLVDLSLDWHDAPSDVKDFLVELQTLKRALSETNTNIILNPDFTSAFEGRHSAVLSQFGKDAPSADARLMVDNCRSELSDLLADLEKRSRGHRVGWERIKSVFLAKRTREAVAKLQRQCQTLNGLVAIDNTAINATILKEVREGRKAQEDQEAAAHRDKILSWLTPISYAAQQHDFSGRRRPGTGEWLLTSEEYRAWRDADEGTHTLFCPGIPGAGKTIMSSLIIEDLITRFAANEAVCVAYVYCNFGRHAEQKAGDLLSNLLKQLAQNQKSPPSSLRSLYEKHENSHTRPSLDELRTVLVSVAQHYERAYIVIDALDESPIDERDRVLEALAEVQRGWKVKVLATSRPEVLSQFREHFEPCDMKEIRAAEEDVGKYVDDQLANVRPRVSKLIRGLEKAIREKLVEAANGMFLLATLQLGYLLDKPTKGDIEDALGDLPRGLEGLDVLYAEAMKRISAQSEGPRELTLKVLSWIVHAKRPLKTVELQHALAIRLGTRELDDRYIPEVEAMVSGAAGLVTIDEEGGTIRLVHFTTQDYFERTRAEWFVDAETFLADACATYLSFDVFDAYDYWKGIEDRRNDTYPLYNYAAHHFCSHACESSSEGPIQSVVGFLEDTAKLNASARCTYGMSWPWRLYHSDTSTWFTGLHLAAYMGDERSVGALLKRGISPDALDFYKRTPLIHAAGNGHVLAAEVLLAHGANPESNGQLEETPLIMAAKNGQDRLVELLLSHGVDIDKESSQGDTPLLSAVYEGHEGTVALLIAGGASLYDKRKPPRSALNCAARCESWGHGVAIVQMLLNQNGVDVNIKDRNEETPLWMAVCRGRALLASTLLAHSATNPNITCYSGETPLHRAAGGGCGELTTILVADSRTNVNARRDDGTSPLLAAMLWGVSVVLRPLLSHDKIDVNLENEWGLTPLLVAVEAEADDMVEQIMANDSIDVNKRGPNGWTALARAAWAGNVHLTALLLVRGDTDLDCPAKTGETPLDLAAKNERREIVRMLLSAREKAGIRSPERFERLLREWEGREEESVRVYGLSAGHITLGPTSVPWCRAGSFEGITSYLFEMFENVEFRRGTILARPFRFTLTSGRVILPSKWAKLVKPGTDVLL